MCGVRNRYQVNKNYIYHNSSADFFKAAQVIDSCDPRPPVLTELKLIFNGCRKMSVTLNGFSSCCFRYMQETSRNLAKKSTSLRDNCKDGPLFWYLLLLQRLALPDISHYLSQGRYLI